MTVVQSAHAFFDACETGRGWAACKAYCLDDASFSSQAEPLLEIETLAAYADWMRDLLGPIPDAHYELRSFALDAGRGIVSAFAVFKGTHIGEGGPVPPTGRSVQSDYVYAMEFKGEKIAHVTKIWHSGLALKQLGWA